MYSKYSLLSDNFKSYYANAKYKPTGYAASYRSFLEEKRSRTGIRFLDSLHPNDILAIAYLNSIRKNKLSLVPIPVKRVSSLNSHNLESASQLRDNLRSSGLDSLKDSLSENVFAILKRETEHSRVPSFDRFYDLALAKYRLSSSPSSYTAESGGGVHELLMKAAMRSCSGEEMLSLAATKKYTNTRLRRAALYYLLEIYEECLHESPAYTLLLAANEKGRKYLSASRRNNDFSILTKPSASNDLSDRAKAQYLLLQRADNLYALCLEKCLPGAEYLRRSPTIL